MDKHTIRFLEVRPEFLEIAAAGRTFGPGIC